MATPPTVWPYKDGKSHNVTIKSLTYKITPQGDFGNGPTTFIISSPDDNASETDIDVLKNALSQIITYGIARLHFDNGNVQDVVIQPTASNSTGLGGEYSLSLPPQGSAAKRGGKSVRSHYRKRKSSRHVSKKRYSVGRRGRGRGRSARSRSRKN
jgi:hypothetical protein